MNLIVSTPFAVAVNASDVRHVRGEDATGAFGILHGHADFLTALTASVLVWRDQRGQEHYVVLPRGMLSVHQDTVTVVAPEAVTGEDLRQLETEVLGRYRRQIEQERVARTDAHRLQLAAIRQIVRLLRPQPDGSPRASDIGQQA